MSRSTFSPLGLDLGENAVNMTYLYGLSDFFSVMFEDTETINTLLEAESEVAASTYSTFLQMASTISLEDIQNTLGEPIKLITLGSSSKILGEVNTYRLPLSILSTRYIANRPMLPTELLEQGVDYNIEEVSSGVFNIRFAKSISESVFPSRILSDGSIEYALWFVDTEIDKKWMSDYYGSLIGVDPKSSTESFRNFVYGLYYIYANGPTLELIKKGLNLCLGVPLARESETVLEVRKYLETDQYLVVTDANQYLIPYGIDPSVTTGQLLGVGDELAEWVEVKDYLNDGDWWINLLIPPSVIPNLPKGQNSRYATEGSHFDYLMRTYLKKHTFLVNVKVNDFKQSQIFQQLSDIIRRAKPTYTQAVYIWTIPSSNLDETITASDQLQYRIDQFRCENLTIGIDKFYRSNSSEAQIKRGCPMFIRYNAPFWVTKVCGENTYVNGDPFQILDGTSKGFINPMSQYRSNNPLEKAWLRTVNERGSETLLNTRSKIGFSRGAQTVFSQNIPTDVVNAYGLNYERIYDIPVSIRTNWNLPPVPDLSQYWVGEPSHPLTSWAKVPVGMKIIPMYVTNRADISAKCVTAGIVAPLDSEWMFSLFNTFLGIDAIDQNAIDSQIDSPIAPPTLISNYSTFSTRGANYEYISNIIPDLGKRQWNPGGTSGLTPDDYLLGVNILPGIVGIYLVTGSNSISNPAFYPVECTDPLETSFTAPMHRGLGSATLSSAYTVRGRGIYQFSNPEDPINESAVNDPAYSAVLYSAFTDLKNVSPIPITRDDQVGTKVQLIHFTEIK